MGKPIHLARRVSVNPLLAEGFEPRRGSRAHVSLVIIAVDDDGLVGVEASFAGGLLIQVGQWDVDGTRYVLFVVVFSGKYLDRSHSFVHHSTQGISVNVG